MKTCKQCNAVLENKQNFCLVCGAKVERKTTSSHNKNSKKINKKGIVIASCVAGILLAGGIAIKLVLLPVIEQSNTYKEAVSCYTSGEYEQAQELFTKLGNYKDAEQKATDSCIGRAEKFLSDGDFGHAKEVLDSVKSTDDIKAMKKKCDYSEAEAYVEKEQYQAAYNIFTELAEKNYKDADALAKKILPQAAKEAYESIIAEYEENSEPVDSYSKSVYYKYFDLEKDGDNELFLSLGHTDLKVYSFKNGSVKKLLDEKFNHYGFFIYYDYKSKMISVTTGGDDHFQAWYFKLSETFKSLGHVVEDWMTDHIIYSYEINNKKKRYNTFDKLEKDIGFSSNTEFIDLWN